MRVLVIDDSAFMRQAIRRMLESDPRIEVVGCARNGTEGLDMARRLRPDVVTLDVEMPDIDGLTVLRRIMAQCPTRVLMLSSLTTAGSQTALRALKLGAADVLAKDRSQVSANVHELRDQLVTRVRALAHAKPESDRAPRHDDTPDRIPPLKPNRFDAVCIGSSTGGPPVLETLLADLPKNWKTPIVVAQHMPALFTRSLAERLEHFGPVQVRHGQDQMPLERATIYICPGGMQTRITKEGLGKWRLRVTDEQGPNLYKPSVDLLFESAADAFGSRVLALVLTGMGEDGLQGARKLHARKAVLLAQNAGSCVVYGMPKAVTEAGLVDASLDPARLRAALEQLGPGHGAADAAA